MIAKIDHFIVGKKVELQLDMIAHHDPFALRGIWPEIKALLLQLIWIPFRVLLIVLYKNPRLAIGLINEEAAND